MGRIPATGGAPSSVVDGSGDADPISFESVRARVLRCPDCGALFSGGSHAEVFVQFDDHLPRCVNLDAFG